MLSELWLCVCLLQGLDQRGDSGALLWQALNRSSTWQPGQGRAGVTASRQSHWARVRTVVLTKHRIATKGRRGEVVSPLHLSGTFPPCFPITSGPPMELKPNPSVSYTKVWGSQFVPKTLIEVFIVWNTTVGRVQLDVTCVFQTTRMTTWTSPCPWRATGRWTAAATRSGGTLASQAALRPPVGFCPWSSSMTKSAPPAWASWLDMGENR